MRRIQREWKDAIAAGVAFDWERGVPVVVAAASTTTTTTTTLSRRSSKTCTTTTPHVSSPQHLWIGPLSLSQWWIWHFTFVGVASSPYAGGLYHGRILLPRTYPAQPPRVQLLTSSGRFATCSDICLSASNFHPETWQPSVCHVRSLAEAVRWHMLTPSNEVGGVTASLQERQELARQSRSFAVTVQSGRRKLVRINHAQMLQAGWIQLLDSLQPDIDENHPVPVETTESLIAPPHPELIAVVEHHHQQQPIALESSFARPMAKRKKQALIVILIQSLLHICQSPVRLAILAFCALFAFLNRT
jgi:ubiquitin-protein ligase